MEQNLGYVKIYRQMLKSEIHRKSFAARACFIDILLLLDRKTGVLCSTVTDLAKLLCVKDRKTMRKVLHELEECGVIKITWTTPLQIMVPGWAFYQRIKKVERPEKATKEALVSEENFPTEPSPKVRKNSPPSEENFPTAEEKFPTKWGKNPQPTYAYKQERTRIYNKNILQEREFSKNAVQNPDVFLNFSEPKTDLEKFVNFYLKGIESPLLKKDNKVIIKALKNDIPHFESILERTKDLSQAKRVLERFIKNATGKYSIYYLATQIDAWRQEDEEKQNGKI